MTRAEEAANKAYPKYWAKAILYDGQTVEFDAGEEKRMVFIQGYELAEKDTIDYACYELELRLPEYLNYNGIQVERAEFIKDFRKAMEDEK